MLYTIEENALHVAALAYARARYQSLETRMRVDRAREVAALLVEIDPTTDREVFQRDELDPALELARLTLLDAGEKDLFPESNKGVPQLGATQSLLGEVQKAIRVAQGQFSTPDRTMRAALFAFNLIVGLVGTCRRLAGDPVCARDGDCPEHGRKRPGQCVPEGEKEGEKEGSRLPAPGSGQNGEER